LPTGTGISLTIEGSHRYGYYTVIACNVTKNARHYSFHNTIFQTILHPFMKFFGKTKIKKSCDSLQKTKQTNTAVYSNRRKERTLTQSILSFFPLSTTLIFGAAYYSNKNIQLY